MPHDEHGREVLDTTPIAVPLRVRPAAGLRDQIREILRSEKLAEDLDATGVETFEESEDFDIEDDDFHDPHSPFELEFEPDGPEEDINPDALEALKQVVRDALKEEEKPPEDPPEKEPEKDRVLIAPHASVPSIAPNQPE